jgi:hypothetical protein
MEYIWRGITYPSIDGWLPEWFYKIWKNVCCPRGWHLLDEVYGSCGCDFNGMQCNHPNGYKHYLTCDACNFDVELKEI